MIINENGLNTADKGSIELIENTCWVFCLGRVIMVRPRGISTARGQKVIHILKLNAMQTG
jgi:hypothetical protein